MRPGQDNSVYRNAAIAGNSERGYAMAALLVALSIAAIMMTVAMPVWKQTAQREKEEELIFRGLQYTRAIRLFGRKFANANPPTIDVLVEQRFIRKKFKDPITNDDFQPILAGQAVPGATTQTGTAGSGRGGSPSSSPSSPNSQTAPAPLGGTGRGARGTTAGGIGAQSGPGAAPGSAGATGGIIGVVSKSKDKSIRVYNGRTHYNEWAFINVQQVQAPGVGGVGGAVAPGQRGQRGQPGVGGRGRGNPNGPQRGPFNPSSPGPFGPGRGPTTPFPPATNPFQPATPIQPGTGRGRGQ